MVAMMTSYEEFFENFLFVSFVRFVFRPRSISNCKLRVIMPVVPLSPGETLSVCSPPHSQALSRIHCSLLLALERAALQLGGTSTVTLGA